MKSFLVVNDRCHYDTMIDPRRFSIYHFYSTLNFIFKFLPKPDLVFFINSSAKNILNRSSELSKETLLDNIRKYENFLKKNRSIFNLKSDNTCNKISEIIISEIYKKINLKAKKIFLKLK
jgi:thymidylate kinase